jgi:hypothetical protein
MAPTFTVIPAVPVKVIAITSETRRSPLGDLIDSDLFVLSTAKFKIHDRLRLPLLAPNFPSVAHLTIMRVKDIWTI